MPELHSPWLLLLLVPILLGTLLVRRRRRSPGIVFPSIRSVGGRPTLRRRMTSLPAILTALGVVLLVLAAARPRLGVATSAIRREGIAIQMVLDRSGSMDQELDYGGRPIPKIDIVKEIFTDFVAGGGDLPGRESDLLGLTTFARFAEENCPLVALHEPLLSAVGNLRTVAPYLTAARSPTRNQQAAKYENPLNATAIGEGLKRAVLALVAAEEDLARGPDDEQYRIRGKVVILLTDGQNNSGVDPLEAAELARANGVRVYSVVLFGRNIFQEDIFGRRVQRRLSEDDLANLTAVPREIAEATGGRSWLAEDGDALRDIYEEIDALEKIDLGDLEFRSYHERFAIPLVAGILMLLLAGILDETWLRRSP